MQQKYVRHCSHRFPANARSCVGSFVRYFPVFWKVSVVFPLLGQIFMRHAQKRDIMESN
jgi:hypothetical protein